MTESHTVTEPVACSDDLLRVYRQNRGDATLVQVVGEMDLVTIHVLDEHLAEVERTVLPSAHVTLDLDGVTFMGSAGLSCLLRYHERRRLAGGALRVAATSRVVLRTIDLSGLRTVLTVVDPAVANG